MATVLPKDGELQGPPTEPLNCTQGPTQALASGPLRRLPSESPPPRVLSINAIMRQHPRARLYVRPALWTAQHLQLLDCHFIIAAQERRPKKETEKRDASTVPPPRRRSLHAANLTSRLQSASDVAAQTLAIVNLLDACDIYMFLLSGDGCGMRIPYMRTELSIYFNGRIADTLLTDGMFTCNGDIPVLACVNLDTARWMRDMTVNGRSPRQPNDPVSRIRQKKLDRLTPPIEAEDPYLVAVLIALAQEQRRQRPRAAKLSDSQTPRTASNAAEGLVTEEPFRVCVIGVPAQTPKELHIYSSTIPASFLDRFDHPAQSFPSCPVQISYLSIPLTSPKRLVYTLRKMVQKGNN
ncbi:hypothetical protein B0T24DRAFT_357233 [Lasiosphaeria ovina]|uniref:Uncharacterized protein n=1 Tax=Lasiosphaeria ovina TaxID=92902 RepID=A0AAE0K406_9PEZI|nr:hypothetical protein B0T24DRAFT_357233 [Lasiosphaeria ovina]